MPYSIRNASILKTILWADTLLGGGTAAIGLIFLTDVSILLGLSTSFVSIVSFITLAYAVVAFMLAYQKSVSISRLRILIIANWVWAVVSVVLFIVYYKQATPLGIAFLVLQLLTVAALAWLEAAQVEKISPCSWLPQYNR